MERKGLSSTVQLTVKRLVRFKATAEPIDLPIRIICYDVNLR